MSLPNRIEAYSDCFEVFDQAVANRGARVEFADYGDACQFGMRMHQARALQRERHKRLYATNDPAWGSSEYDQFMVRKPREDAAGHWWVYIEPAGSNILSIEPLETVDGDHA